MQDLEHWLRWKERNDKGWRLKRYLYAHRWRLHSVNAGYQDIRRYFGHANLILDMPS